MCYKIGNRELYRFAVHRNSYSRYAPTRCGRTLIYGSRFRLILLTRFLFIQDFLAFASNLLPAPLSRRIRVPHLPAIKNISSCFCLIRAASVPLLNVSKPPRRAVVPNRRDVFAKQKLASSSVHGCTLLDRLFSKGLRKGFSVSTTSVSATVDR